MQEEQTAVSPTVPLAPSGTPSAAEKQAPPMVPPQDLVELTEEDMKLMSEKAGMPIGSFGAKKMRVSKDFLEKLRKGQVTFVRQQPPSPPQTGGCARQGAPQGGCVRPGGGGPQILQFPGKGMKSVKGTDTTVTPPVLPFSEPPPAPAPAPDPEKQPPVIQEAAENILGQAPPEQKAEAPASHRLLLEQRYAEVIRKTVLTKKTDKFPASTAFRSVTPEAASAAPGQEKPVVSSFMEDCERLTRTRGKPTRVLSIRPPTAPSILQECRAPVKLVLSQHQSPGDILMLTRAVDDLHRTYPKQFITSIRTPAMGLWENNPNVVPIADDDQEAMWIACEYKLVNTSNAGAHHFVHGFRKDLEAKLGLPIDQTHPWGAVYISAQEKSWFSQVYELTKKNLPYWIVDAGRKSDYTAKMWDTAKFQKVVDMTPDITWVQIGAGDSGHVHPRLKGPNVIDLVGKTNVRQLVRLMYHAAGVLTPVSFPMHLAAAVEMHPRYRRVSRPCIVLAGGREPSMWEAYSAHQYIHCCGALPCCRQGGCWKSRVEPVGDGDEKDTHNLCEWPVITPEGQALPKCMDLISAEEVVSRIRIYTDSFDYSSEDDQKWSLKSWPPAIPESIQQKVAAAKAQKAATPPTLQAAGASESATVPETTRMANAPAPVAQPTGNAPAEAPKEQEMVPESAETPKVQE
jgi:hypothetical protein